MRFELESAIILKASSVEVSCTSSKEGQQHMCGLWKHALDYSVIISIPLTCFSAGSHKFDRCRIW